MIGLTIFFVILYAVITPIAATFWPQRNVVMWVWAIQAIAVYPLLWQLPGIVAVIVGMVTLLIFLRALDANTTFEERAGHRYSLYCHWLLTHPSERRDLEPASKCLLRFVRGCLFLAAAFGLLKLGKQIELWHTYPYLDDLMMAAELTMAFVGSMDIITAICMALGVQFFIVDGVAADYAFAPSLRAFWNRWWNRPMAGVLKRGIFLPSGGRHRRVRGVLLVFFASGILHAIPLILAGEQRMLWLVLALGTMGFFMIHGLALCLEGVLPRTLRRGLFARVYFYLVMAISLPLYPSAGMIAFGAHNRPPETATILRVLEVIKGAGDNYESLSVVTDSIKPIQRYTWQYRKKGSQRT